MKIIGDAGNSKFIVEASADELANLAGLGSKYNFTYDLKPGLEIKINKMYQKLYDFENRTNEIERVRSSLKQMLDTLEPVKRTLDIVDGKQV